jgi:hypothetical protein
MIICLQITYFFTYTAGTKYRLDHIIRTRPKARSNVKEARGSRKCLYELYLISNQDQRFMLTPQQGPGFPKS